MNKKQQLGNRIQERRKFLCLSQKELAEGCGLKIQDIKQIEKGEREVKAWELKRIADFLKIEVNDFFKPAKKTTPIVFWDKF